MNQGTERISCPYCQAANFPTSTVCWQCGRALRAQQDQPPAQPPMTPPPPGPTEPGPAYGPPPASSSNTLVIVGFILAALGICCCPIFSIVGIILGVMALQRGNSLGTWVIVASAVTLLLGVVLFAIGFSSGFNQALRGYRPGQPLPIPIPR